MAIARVAMFRFVILLMALGILGAPCWSKNSKSKGHKHKNDAAVVVEERTVYFRPTDVPVITRYYTPRPLPPGLQKKLYRTGQLPPGWEKRMHPMPVVVERQLPVICVGCGRGVIDNYAVVYDKKTNVILDLAALAIDLSH